MSAPTLQREPKSSERPWPWIAFAAVLAGASVVLVTLASSGALESIVDKSLLGRELRGYTGTGLFLGVFGVSCSLAAMVYSLRKRAMQERFPAARGTMMAWLWAHVALGSLAFVAVVLHAGFGVISFNFSTGKLLFVVFFLLVASGVVWRLVYAAVPSVAAPRIGNYSKIGNERRAEEQLTEIDKLAAGRSPEVRRIKDWLLEMERPGNDIQNAVANLPADDRKAVLEIHALAGSRRRALQRIHLQGAYTRVLQGWRVLHIPLTIVFVPLLVWHVIAALEVPAKLSSVGAVPIPSLSGLHPSGECASCHKSIVEQWSHSMHAHGLTSPVTVAQNNQLLTSDLGEAPSPDPRQVCVNCHGPISTAIVDTAKLPFQRALYDRPLLDEGVSCATCHQLDREVGAPGTMGLTASQAFFHPGSTYFGEYEDAVGNAFHRSEAAGVWKGEPERLCTSCHDVSYDTNGDGKIVKGVDLVLQQTIEEFARWQKVGGTGTCLTCHMPVVAEATRLAEAASIPFEQDREAPPREVHDHSFVGVDYPLDEVAKNDPQRDARLKLLRESARIKIEDAVIDKNAVTFKVKLTNVGAGHNLPTGLAFARQLWLEVVVKDGAGHTVLSSGVIDDPTQDLCDASTLDDPGNPMAKLVEGCKKSDVFLVNLQQKLVTKFRIVVDDKTGEKQVDDFGEFKLEQADDAEETALQHLRSAPVPRTRPFDKQKLGTLSPREERRFGYKIELVDPSAAHIKVRLLFRSLPPYMLRALGKDQGAEETPLKDLIPNLQIVEIDSAETTVK